MPRSRPVRPAGGGGGTVVLPPTNLPAWIQASDAFLRRCIALREASKTRVVRHAMIGDSNSAGYYGTGMASWRETPYARLDRRLQRFVFGAAPNLCPAYVVKPMSPGRPPSEQVPDAPWGLHPANPDRRWFGEASYEYVGSAPRAAAGGFVRLQGADAPGTKWLGFLVDARPSGADWERNKRSATLVVAKGHDTFNGVGPGAQWLNGSPPSGGAGATGFGRILVEMVDVGGVAPANYGSAPAYRTMIVDCRFGGGLRFGGVHSPALALDGGKQTLIRLSAMEGMGGLVEALILRDGATTGYEVLDWSFSGAATLDAATDTAQQGAAFLFQWAAYAGKVGNLLRDEYASPGVPFGLPGSGNVALGLDSVSAALHVNDLLQGLSAADASARYESAIARSAGVASPPLWTLHLPPCPAFFGSSDTASDRDRIYDGIGREPYSAYRASLRSLAARYPAQVAVVDHQARLGDLRPSEMRRDLGVYGADGRRDLMSFDGAHYPAQAYQDAIAETTARLLEGYGVKPPPAP